MNLFRACLVWIIAVSAGRLSADADWVEKAKAKERVLK